MAGRTFFNDAGLNPNNEPVMNGFDNNPMGMSQGTMMSPADMMGGSNFNNGMNQGMMQPVNQGPMMNQGTMVVNPMEQNNMMSSMDNSMNQNMVNMNPMMNQGMQQPNMDMNNMNSGMLQEVPMMNNKMNQSMMQEVPINNNMMNQPINSMEQMNEMNQNNMIAPVSSESEVETLDLTPTAQLDVVDVNMMNNNSMGMNQMFQMNDGMMNNGMNLQMNNGMNGQVSPVMNNEMATLQTFGGVNQVPNVNPMIDMSMNNNMNQGMMQQPNMGMNNQQGMNPMTEVQTGANQGFINPGLQQQPMFQPMQPINQGRDNQIVNMQSNEGFAGAPQPVVSNEPITPIAPVGGVVNNSNMKMRSRLNNNFKSIFIGGVVLLFTIMLVLVLVFSKTVTCTLKQEVAGVDMEVEVKADFWFDKISKITTSTTINLDGVDDALAESLRNEYSELEDKTIKVEMKNDKIILTKVVRPSKKDNNKMSPDEFEDAYTNEQSFVCK